MSRGSATLASLVPEATNSRHLDDDALASSWSGFEHLECSLDPFAMTTLTRLPPEVLRQILLHAHDGQRRRLVAGFERSPRRYELNQVNFRGNLCSLRLVNSLLCQLVTPLLFRHVVISANSGIDRLLALSRSPLRRLVLRLEIGASTQREADPRIFSDPFGTAEEECLAYMTRLAIVFHSALPRFPDIRCLKLDFVDISYGGYWEQETADFFGSMATAMRRSQLDKLDEVDLWLPIAFDFGHFLDGDDAAADFSTESLFKQLAYLDLHYEHSTEEGQGIEFRGDQHNEKYDKNVRQLLSLAPNIHSLWAEGSADCLLLDHSAFSPSLRLKSLDLDSLSISAKDLTAVVRQSTDTLQKVVMRGIYLESGTWGQILVAMSECPLLVDFYIETCDYRVDLETGPREPELSAYDCFIESGKDGDFDALEGVLARLQENKRRIYGDSYDEAADLEQRRADKEGIELKHKRLTAWIRTNLVSEEPDYDVPVWTEDTDSSDEE